MTPVCSDLALLWQIGGSGHGWFILVPCSMCLSAANAMGQSWLVTQRNSFLFHVSIVSWLCHLLWPLLCYCHSVLVGADVGIRVCQAWEVRWYCLDNCRKELLFLPLLQSQWGSCVCWLQWRLGRLMIGLPFTGRDPKKKIHQVSYVPWVPISMTHWSEHLISCWMQHIKWWCFCGCMGSLTTVWLYFQWQLWLWFVPLQCCLGPQGFWSTVHAWYRIVPISCCMRLMHCGGSTGRLSCSTGCCVSFPNFCGGVLCGLCCGLHGVDDQSMQGAWQLW